MVGCRRLRRPLHPLRGTSNVVLPGVHAEPFSAPAWAAISTLGLVPRSSSSGPRPARSSRRCGRGRGPGSAPHRSRCARSSSSSTGSPSPVRPLRPADGSTATSSPSSDPRRSCSSPRPAPRSGGRWCGAPLGGSVHRAAPRRDPRRRHAGDLNAEAFDGARWRAGEALVHSGLPSSSVDAGLEWVWADQPGVVKHVGIRRRAAAAASQRRSTDALLPLDAGVRVVSSGHVRSSAYVPARNPPLLDLGGRRAGDALPLPDPAMGVPPRGRRRAVVEPGWAHNPASLRRARARADPRPPGRPVTQASRARRPPELWRTIGCPIPVDRRHDGVKE